MTKYWIRNESKILETFFFIFASEWKHSFLFTYFPSIAAFILDNVKKTEFSFFLFLFSTLPRLCVQNMFPNSEKKKFRSVYRFESIFLLVFTRDSQRGSNTNRTEYPTRKRPRLHGRKIYVTRLYEAVKVN